MKSAIGVALSIIGLWATIGWSDAISINILGGGITPTGETLFPTDDSFGGEPVKYDHWNTVNPNRDTAIKENLISTTGGVETLSAAKVTITAVGGTWFHDYASLNLIQRKYVNGPITGIIEGIPEDYTTATYSLVVYLNSNNTGRGTAPCVYAPIEVIQGDATGSTYYRYSEDGRLVSSNDKTIGWGDGSLLDDRTTTLGTNVIVIPGLNTSKITFKTQMSYTDGFVGSVAAVQLVKNDSFTSVRPVVQLPQNPLEKGKLILKGFYRGLNDVATYGIAYTTTDLSAAASSFTEQVSLGALPATESLQWESPLTEDQSVSYAWYYTTASDATKVYSATYTYSPSAASASLRNNLVMYLSGDGSITNKVVGAAPEFPNPTVGGTGVAYAIAPIGRGQAFDLAGSWWINAGKPTCVNTGSFTLSLWLCKKPSNPREYCFFGTQNWSPGTNLGFSVHEKGLTSAWGLPTHNRQNVFPYYTDTADLWQYLTIVVNRADANKMTMTLYKDGALFGTRTLSDPTTVNAYIHESTNLLFGHSGTSNYPSKSYQDEVALWGRALSAEEVSTLYTTYQGVLVEPALYYADATKATTWQTLDWGDKQWVNDLTHPAAITSLRGTFDFNEDVTAMSLWFSGDQPTIFTNTEGKTITAPLWDFSGMTQPVTFQSSIDMTTFQVSDTRPLSIIGAESPNPPQTISATIKGAGGIVISSGTAVINVKGIQNAGGLYTVKTGATLKLGGGVSETEFGSFQTNPNDMLTYTVESGATLELTSNNITGWGVHSQSTYAGTIAGTLRFTGPMITRLSGLFTVEDGAVFDNQSVSRTNQGLCFSGATYEIQPNATATFQGWQFSCNRGSSYAYPIFDIGAGATMNVTASGKIESTNLMTVKGTGRLNLLHSTSLAGGGTLILNGAPTVNATGVVGNIALDIKQTGATLALKDRTEALAFKAITFPATGELILDMAEWKGMSVVDATTPLLTWTTGVKPEGFSIRTINHEGFTIAVEANRVTATPIHEVVISNGGTVSSEVLIYLRGIAPRAISISADDANRAYAFTLTPTVVPETGVATLACSFKLVDFILHTNNTLADIAIDVVSIGSTSAPRLAPNHVIGIFASATDVSADYVQVENATADAITSVEGSTERSRATIMSVPISGRSFFKARLAPLSN